jgi:hypothetical protein
MQRSGYLNAGNTRMSCLTLHGVHSASKTERDRHVPFSRLAVTLVSQSRSGERAGQKREMERWFVGVVDGGETCFCVCQSGRRA